MFISSWAFSLAFLAIIHHGESAIVRKASACQGKHLRITCTGRSTIIITKAMFGRKSYNKCWKWYAHQWNTNCEAPRSLPVMKAVCDGKKICSVEASYYVFEGDPCDTTEKYLEVEYKCIVSGAPIVRTRTACQYSDVSLNCAGGKKIHIIDAIYGRTTVKICKKWYGYFWSTNCKATDSMKKVKELCEGKSDCDVVATDRVFGEDPCTGTEKYLQIQYQCKK